MSGPVRLCLGVRFAFWSVGAAAFLFSLLTPVVRAEISPREYRRMQREAQEEVRIQILHVTAVPVAERVRERERERERLGRAMRVEVEARVLKVERSRGRIHDGEKIRISYVTHTRERNIAGPGEPPVLEDRQAYPAFLEKVEGEGRVFRPAAGAFSFTRIEERRP